MSEKSKEMLYRSTRSSTIIAVGHDAEQNVLGMIFRGGATYHYLACPRAHWREMLSRSERGESVGEYFHAHVRDKYVTQRVDRTTDPALDTRQISIDRELTIALLAAEKAVQLTKQGMNLQDVLAEIKQIVVPTARVDSSEKSDNTDTGERFDEILGGVRP